MLRAMTTAASGMHAQQTRIDSISNNLANVNTIGYKATRLEFQDLLYENLAPTGGVRAGGGSAPAAIEVGHGVRVMSTVRKANQGAPEQTSNPLDLMVDGDGFFQVRLPDGGLGYTRDGSFKIDRDGNVVTSAGYYLEPALSVPPEAESIGIASDGTVSAILSGSDTEEQILGTIELARFVNPAGLSHAGENLLVATPNSGEPEVGTGGSPGFGNITQGFVERSNVEVVTELVNMITAQRAYELNSRTIQTADDMMSTVNSIRR